MSALVVQTTVVFSRSPSQITAPHTCRRTAAALPKPLPRQQPHSRGQTSRSVISQCRAAAVADSMARPSLVLVHGNFGTAAGWSPFQAAMESRGYDVHAVDLPWERSPRTGGVPDLQDYVDALVDFIKSKQLKSVALVGHSFGGVPVSLATEGTASPLACTNSHSHLLRPFVIACSAPREQKLCLHDARSSIAAVICQVWAWLVHVSSRLLELIGMLVGGVSGIYCQRFDKSLGQKIMHGRVSGDWPI